MTLLLQVACVLTIMTLSTLSKSLDVPNYLQVILPSYKVLKEAPEIEVLSQKIDESDGAQSMSPHLESLLQLRRGIYHAYNLTYQIKDPIGRMLYRNEYGDGSGSLKGSINFVKENGKKAVMKYSLQIEEDPISSWEPEPSMRNSADVNEMSEESYSQKEEAQIISVSRANRKLTSSTMDNKGNVIQQEKYFYSPMVDNDFDDLHTLSSQIVEDKVQAPAFDDDMKGSVVVFHVKPKARGYEQVWRKGEGIVVDKQYELPNYEYRSAVVPQQRPDLEAGEDQKPVYVYQTSPAVRVFEMSRDVNGNYQVPDKYNSNIKQQILEDDNAYQIIENYGGNNKQQQQAGKESYRVPQGMEDDDDEEPLYITHSKPAVQIMQLNSDEGESTAFGAGTQEQYSSEYAETETRDGGYHSFNK